MEWKERTIDGENVIDNSYTVLYNDKKLREILEKLKAYRYLAYGEITFQREDLEGLFVTSKKIKEKTAELFSRQEQHKIDQINDESIIFGIDECTRFKAYFTYSRVTDLYHYIDIIINHKGYQGYDELFGIISQDSYREAISERERDQELIENLLYYPDFSEELEALTATGETKMVKELCELYKKALGCFSFALTSVKQTKLIPTITSGTALRKALLGKNNNQKQD